MRGLARLKTKLGTAFNRLLIAKKGFLNIFSSDRPRGPPPHQVLLGRDDQLWRLRPLPQAPPGPPPLAAHDGLRPLGPGQGLGELEEHRRELVVQLPMSIV